MIFNNQQQDRWWGSCQTISNDYLSTKIQEAINKSVIYFLSFCRIYSTISGCQSSGVSRRVSVVGWLLFERAPAGRAFRSARHLAAIAHASRSQKHTIKSEADVLCCRSSVTLMFQLSFLNFLHFLNSPYESSNQLLFIFTPN